MNSRRESDTLRKRVTRYARVSRAAAKVGIKASIVADRQRRAVLLREAMGALKGPLMKIGQMLGSIPDLLPPEYAAELAQLQSDAPSMGWPFVKRRMAAELGPDWQKKFKSFEPEAAAAASLGQVHRAKSLDGRLLACKLQYPDMASVVEADLSQFNLALKLFERFDHALDTGEIQAELADRLREELDYTLEAKHVLLYRRMLANVSGVHVPDVLPELSTDRLLTMTWLDGERLADVADRRSQADRNAIAMNMFRAWYTPFYEYGVIHGDPHLGNYTARSDNSINLLDFGCIRVFRPALVQGVIRLYHALRDHRPELAVEAYEAWGFSHPTKALVDVLNIWAKFVYMPFLKDETQSMEKTNNVRYGREAAARVHRELRRIGGVKVPREFVLMDRASLGLGAVFLRLGAAVNWHRLLQGLIRDFDADSLARRQRQALKEVRIPMSF